MITFNKIYEENARKLYKFLLSLSGNEILAEELVQETFFQAFKTFEKFEGRCSIYTWLCQIGKNAWLKEVKRNKRYLDVEISDLHIPDQSSFLEDQIIKKEEFIRSRKALLNLEEPYRNVFALHAISDVKLKEIANLYGKSESWARVTYYRARMQIVQEVTK